MTRAQFWEEVEASGEHLVKDAASKHALGAAAAALDDIAEVELPGGCKMFRDEDLHLYTSCQSCWYIRLDAFTPFTCPVILAGTSYLIMRKDPCAYT